MPPDVSAAGGEKKKKKSVRLDTSSLPYAQRVRGGRRVMWLPEQAQSKREGKHVKGHLAGVR